MKKFLKEYKHLKSHSATETSVTKGPLGKGNARKVDEMGVFKWLRRERVTVTTRRPASPGPGEDLGTEKDEDFGTIRTEDYKRDLAEFQARRSTAKKDRDLSPSRRRDLSELQARRSTGRDLDLSLSRKRDLAEFQAGRSTGKSDLDLSPSAKRDLAEFQARRSSLKEVTPKKQCGRHSLPVSCTTCTADADATFNYEKKSAVKYKKKSQRRARSTTAEGAPNIQFLFQNQVFMPGNLFAHSTYKTTRSPHPQRQEEEYFAQRQLNFKEDDDPITPPLFYKNNSLPFDEGAFLRDREEVDGGASSDIGPTEKVSSHHSSSSGETSKTSSKADSCDAKLTEVLCELKSFDQWADEQLRIQSMSSGKSDDSKSDASTYGLPVVALSDIDVHVDKDKPWNNGTWGAVPVQMRRLSGVTMTHVRRRSNVEVDILRKCRHPAVILLMGLYPDVRGDVHIICERCVDSLYGILHVQGRILSAQTAVQYASDVANALLFLRMRGYIHTELTSHCVMVTSRDAAKLADFQPCVKLAKDYNDHGSARRSYELYDAQPQYVNIGAIHAAASSDGEPLLSSDNSEAYLTSNSVSRHYSTYRNSPYYRWHAPELFEADARGFVHPCSRSDVYSLSLVLWESCNALMPWKTLTYDKLKEHYTLWNTGVRLPSDGTYPGALLAALKTGLKLRRTERPDLTVFAATLRTIQRQIDELEYIVIPARHKKRQSNFTNESWNRSPSDSDCQSPQQTNTHADIHTENKDTSTESEKETMELSPLYESIKKEKRMYVSDKCFIRDEDQTDRMRYEPVQEKQYSSACSTPVSKIKAKIKDIGTPGVLHRTDSTEYCSILSPKNSAFSDDCIKDQSEEKASAKLSRSFTPKSYKPLHIKVPEFNLDCIKSLPKEQNGAAQSSYNFDIKNYSLPNTPIARSNKLRKNAWLSGELSVSERGGVKSAFADRMLDIEETKTVQSAPETPAVIAEEDVGACGSKESSQTFLVDEELLSIDEPRDGDGFAGKTYEADEYGLTENRRNSCAGLKKILDPPHEYSESEFRDRTHSWSFRTTVDKSPVNKQKPDEDILAGVNVKPLVAIHERWIYEAKKKTGRSMSLPEDNKAQISGAVKPASHCVDTLQKSLPHLAVRRPLPKFLRGHNPLSPSAHPRNGTQSEQFLQARDNIAKCLSLTHEPERFGHSWRRDADTCSNRSVSNSTTSEDLHRPEQKTNAATDTSSIEEFIRDLIRKELQHLLNEISDESFETQSKSEDLLNRGVANVLDALKTDEEATKKEIPHSKFKINGTTNPVVQITFSRSGENSLQVSDNCVNVTISDGQLNLKEKQNKSFDKLNKTLDDTLTDDFHSHSLKRCQTFRTLQEARSTEDLYIDDDLSTQMQENFGGKVKLIPLHGSLHEILCEREDDCCLIKFKQENGCDTIYFKCDNSDTESRDAIDGACNPNQDTVLYKRISLIEERVQRIYPKDKGVATPILLRKKRRVDTISPRPKSEVFTKQLTKESRALSNSSPSLPTCDERNNEIEVNIENVMSYQDSSSDECLKCQADYDDFELLEEEIDKEMSNSSSCKCLEKISEENLSTINEETSEKEQSEAEGKI